jgi:IclR family pca regulon transcriptional regulator
MPDEAALRVLGPGPLPARTPRTLTDPQAILPELSVIRAQGYAVIDQEVELGLQSLAVPLMNAHGRVVAALNVGLAGWGDAGRLPGQFLPPLRAMQAELRRLLS